jgi:hypothetical protein
VGNWGFINLKTYQYGKEPILFADRISEQ